MSDQILTCTTRSFSELKSGHEYFAAKKANKLHNVK